MHRHKWQQETVFEYGTKPHICVKCHVRKMWRGGDYQRWEYIWNEGARAMNGSTHITTHITFIRPECKPIKIIKS